MTMREVATIRKQKGPRIRLPFGPRIGKLVGKIAYFRVKRSRHFFRLRSAWTLDDRIVAGLRGKAELVLFDDAETGSIWTASLADFMANASLLVNRTGRKLALAEAYWTMAGTMPNQLALFPEAASQPAATA
ncbi:MAG: hypothetical protein WC943_13350 [Elusimicrobiota bacterium]|jgi:hypothetical protein